MIDKLNEKFCTGCFACMQKCPKGCITVGKDKDGFLKPEIDYSKCVKCNLCEKVCPQLSKIEFHDTIDAYAMKGKDTELISHSTSAGIFATIASWVLSNGGVVFGVKLTDDHKAKTIFIEKMDSLRGMQGSKYVQSYTGDCYKEAESFLRTGKLVLFSGTPCQIAGLRKYLTKDYSNLYTVDIICHGVPSQELFDSFWAWLEKKHKSKMLEWRFRAKEAEGWAQVDHFVFENKDVFQNEYLNPYTYHFLISDILRESCYNCQFSQQKRVGDITLGDYWGIKRFHADFFSEEGVSLVLANTKHGQELLDKIKDNVSLLPSKIENMQVYNGGLARKPDRPPERDNKYRAFHEMDFDNYVKSELKVKFNLKRTIKSKIPYRVRKNIKRILHR